MITRPYQLYINKFLRKIYDILDINYFMLSVMSQSQSHLTLHCRGVQIKYDSIQTQPTTPLF